MAAEKGIQVTVTASELLERKKNKSIQYINDLNCDKGRLCFCVEYSIKHKQTHESKPSENKTKKYLLIYEKKTNFFKQDIVIKTKHKENMKYKMI